MGGFKKLVRFGGCMQGGGRVGGDAGGGQARRGENDFRRLA